MVGQIYVEHLASQETKHQYPLLFNAANAQTGTAKLAQHPDAREGWATYFLRQGYERGRSPWLPVPGGTYSGNLSAYSTTQISGLFTAPQAFNPLPYPQTINHTQWPGTGLAGDPVYDAFYASQVQLQSNATLLAEYNNHSYAALLDRIGPAIVLTHSQAGPFRWQLGDARPGLVKGIVAMEPEGPPFDNWAGYPFREGYVTPGEGRPYGLTILPVHYNPPIGTDASLLQRVTVPAVDDEILASCERQAEPARRLVELAKVPVLMVTSEASYHAVYVYCTAAYLQQAGVNVTCVRLPEVGIHGNGHFMFMGKNNLEVIGEVIEPWVRAVR